MASLPSLLTVTLVATLWSLPSATVLADEFVVWGRVYSARALAPDEEMPENDALAGAPDGEVLISSEALPGGGDPTAPAVVGVRDLARVEVLPLDSDDVLGSYVTRYQGGYLISFTAPAAVDETTGARYLDVRFVVYDAVTGGRLFESRKTRLFPWTSGDRSLRFIRIVEDLGELGGGGAVTGLAPAGSVTGIFTRVGKIEYQFIDRSDDPSGDGGTGLATVPSAEAARFAIPAYQNAPFGGNLYLFGAFSAGLYGDAAADEVYYKIGYENLDAGATGYLEDDLFKTRYEVDFTTGTSETSRVKLGPLDGSTDTDGPVADCLHEGRPVCYELTPLSEGADVFWSFPDLIALWRTTGLNDRYRLTIEEVRRSGASVYVPVGQTRLVLQLDNRAPVARIESLDPSEPDPAAPDATPLIYTPAGGAVPASNDLLDLPAPLGSFPTDYNAGPASLCAVFDLAPSPEKFLAFKLTAHHAGGYMRYWDFRFKRNDGGYQTHVGKVYSLSGGGSMVDFGDTRVDDSAATDVHGFEHRYLYLAPDDLGPSADAAPTDCGYRFVIRAATRATDGYHYLRYRWDEDIHCLQFSSAGDGTGGS